MKFLTLGVEVFKPGFEVQTYVYRISVHLAYYNL